MDIPHKFETVDEYFGTVQGEGKAMLEEMRAIVTKAAPNATEVISYNMPAIKQNKMLVYYAAYKEHIGFYPTAAPMEAFKDRLTKYKTSKGAMQFPIGEPLPAKLIKDIVVYRITADNEKAAVKKK